MDTALSRHFFILGCERSGSTWVSNVLAAHPEIEFFMEPFADYTNIFPGFPSRNCPIKNAEEPLVNLVQAGYARLPALKTMFFYKRGSSPYLKTMDRLVCRVLAKLCRSVRLRMPQKVEQFQLLNLNASEVSIREQYKKNAIHKLIITKELRLNFKVGLLKQAFPNFKCLIIIRHPGAQIGSIKRLMQKGGLGELKRALLSFAEHINNSKRFGKYHFLMADWSQKSEEEKLLIWWIINYDVLIEDCKNYGVDYLLVKHEDISANPLEQYRSIFNFSGIDCHESVEKYIISSSTAKGHQVTSSVDTSRDSATYCRETIMKISPELHKLIQHLFERVELCDEMKSYREW